MKNQQKAKIPAADFIKLVETLGPSAAARKLNISVAAVHHRRRKLEEYFCRQITSPRTGNGRVTRFDVQHAARLHFEILNGTVLIGSDAHIWPGPMTTAMRGFIKFAADLKPRILILNGDVLDFPKISRHPPIGWESTPGVAEEIAAAQGVLQLIEEAVPRNCKLVWTLGNHDGRFETRIATLAPELAEIHGVHLHDHFNPRWGCCWSTFINQNVVVKHRFKNGIHAPHNNAVNSGTSIITGHLHSQRVSPWTDYSGTRYGVDTGCLADPMAEAFVHYSEDSPKNWRSGFAVLTFVAGELLPPELVTVWDRDTIVFRGQLIRV